MGESGGQAQRGAPEAALAEIEDIGSAIVALWRETLELSAVPSGEDFFSLGGDSLRAVQMLAEIEDRFGAPVSFPDFVEAPTVAALAAAVLAGGTDGLRTSRPTEPAPQPVADCGASPAEAAAPCSYAQESLWALELAGAGSTYNEAVALELMGLLDVPALRQALADLVRRHGALRTTIASDGGVPFQRIAGELELTLASVSLPGARDAQVRGRLTDFARAPFDLELGPLLRAQLFELGPERQMLVLVLHHIICDGWSHDLLLGELGRLYDAHHLDRRPELPDLTLEYADFATWQRSELAGERLVAEGEFWRAHLAGAPTVLRLGQRRVGAARLTFEGETHRTLLGPAVAEGLRALCRREQVTPYMVGLAAFATLLYRRSGQDDVLISGPMANREPRFKAVVGFFANTVVVRVGLAGNPSFRELLPTVRRSVLSSYQHQHMPLDLVIDAVAPAREPGVTPLVQVNFRVRAGGLPTADLSAVASRRVHLDLGAARFELALELRVLDDGIEAELSWNTELFERSAMHVFAANFGRLLEAAVSGPDTRLLGFQLAPEPPARVGTDASSPSAPSIRGFRAGRRAQA